MNDDRTLWLLNGELDGELGQSERAEVDTLLAARPELVAERQALRDLVDCLSRVPAVDPPVDLAPRIMDRVRLPRRRTALRYFSRWLQAPMALPFATFAAGILVAVGAYWTLPHDLVHGDARSMVGSIVRDLTRAGVEPQDQLRIDQSALSGEVTLGAPASDVRILEFDVQSAGPVDIAIDLAGSGLRFDSFAQREAGVDLVASDPGRVLLRSQGKHYFAIFLRSPRDAAPTGLRIGLAFSDRQQQFYRGVLQTP